MNISDFNKRAQFLKKANHIFFKRLQNKTPKNLDDLFEAAHNEVFEHTDCLACGNCCRTTSPVFNQRDVEKAAKGLKIKPGQFVENFLRVDEDNDLVLKGAPCPFLEEDNRCRIYDYRPTACREYPHTNRKKMRQILDLTFKNSLVCPAVLSITEKLKIQLEKL
ncbi:MAG: YkgJ family cysteine cluster protein [bacterium]|nr:YkgJ family cysteine cluster protein [bacterium]